MTPHSHEQVHSRLATWKIFFLFFGSFSFAFGLVLAYLLPDTQSKARWLSPRQRDIALARVRDNQTVSADKEWKWPQFWEALRDPQTAFFFTTAVYSHLCRETHRGFIADHLIAATRCPPPLQAR